MRSLPKFLPAAVLFLVIGLGCNREPEPEIEQVIDRTKEHFAPDSRVALFEVQAEQTNGSWLLKGETTISEAKAALLDSLSTLELSLKDSIRVLPSANLEGQTASFYEVSYPDGRRGYVPIREAKPFNEWNEELNTSQTSLIETSKTMMGAPYLWGGTSTKGMDCSGFTKTIYFLNGMILPRDASQQIKAGIVVDDQRNFDRLQAGDLLFFGRPATDTEPRRVVHVGMWIGDMQFIHSAGRVHVSSVDSSAENFDPYNLNRYLESRRYLNNRQGNIIGTADIYKWLEGEGNRS